MPQSNSIHNFTFKSVSKYNDGKYELLHGFDGNVKLYPSSIIENKTCLLAYHKYNQDSRTLTDIIFKESTTDVSVEEEDDHYIFVINGVDKYRFALV